MATRQTDKDLLECVNNAYDLESATSTWLRKFARHANQAIDSALLGSQCVWYEKIPNDSHYRIKAGAFYDLPSDAEKYAVEILKLAESPNTDIIASLSPGLYSFLDTPVGRADPDFFHRQKIGDFPRVREYAALIAPSGQSVFMLGGLARDAVSVATEVEARWSAVTPHIFSGFRMRESLVNGHALKIASIHADDDYRVLYADQGYKDHASLKDRLREMVRDFDRLRRSQSATLSDLGPLLPLLASGRFTLVDMYESDGRHFIIAIENSDRHVPFFGLNELHARLAACVAARGEKYYTIGLEEFDGMSETTMTTLMSSVYSQLRVGSRKLLTVTASPAAQTQLARLGDLNVAISCSPATVVSFDHLSPKQRLAAEGMLRFCTRTEIAAQEEEKVTVSTIDKRLRATYTKLGVGNCYEFFCKCKGLSSGT